jgi:hypothetical protein
MAHDEDPSAGEHESQPRFGVLLLVLAAAVAVIVAVTFASLAWVAS